jgi:hypothetical protein
MRTKSRRLFVFGALQLLVITIAATVAVAAGNERPDAVYGAYHCTRYARRFWCAISRTIKTV